MNNEDVRVLAVMGTVFSVIGVISFIFYLVGAISRFKYLRVRSYSGSVLAFVPIANIWAIVEATYGPVDKINLYGWYAPAIVLKLWTIVSYVLALVINVIPGIGNALSLLLTILNVAIQVMIYRDMMERLDSPQPKEGFGPIVAVIIHIIADIMVLRAARDFRPGDQDWKSDYRPLYSQTITGGPLSSLNR